MAETYKCAVCKQVFEKEWTEEESRAELKKNFGDISVEDCEMVCDDCYKKIMDKKYIVESFGLPTLTKGVDG